MATTFRTQAFKAISPSGTYDSQTRAHPALAYFEKCQSYFDSGAPHTDHSSLADFYTEEFSVHSPHGERVASASGDGFNASHVFPTVAKKFYAGPLEAYKHFYQEIVALDAQDGNGYDAYWLGRVFADVKGKAHGAGEMVKDPEGREWDVEIPVAFHFVLVKDAAGPEGFKMRHCGMFKDTGMVNDVLEKRGHGHLKSVK